MTRAAIGLALALLVPPTSRSGAPDAMAQGAMAPGATAPDAMAQGAMAPGATEPGATEPRTFRSGAAATQSLSSDLDRIFADPLLARALVGARVESLGDGRV